MYVQRQSVTVTTDDQGDAVAYTPHLQGLLSQIRYVKPESGGFAEGVDFSITNETTGETIWAQDNVDASATVAPRQPTHSTAGVAALHAADGTAVNAPIAIAGDRLKITVANGGDGGAGTFHFILY